MFGQKSEEPTKIKKAPVSLEASVDSIAPANGVAGKSLDEHIAKIKSFNAGDSLALSDINGDDYNKLNYIFSEERNSGKLRFEHDQDTCTLKVVDGDG